MSKLAKSIAIIGVISVMVPIVFGATNADLQAQINTLLVQLHTLQAQLSFQSTFDFTQNLTIGSQGTEVNALQNFLVSNDAGLKAQALSDHGLTSYFGPLTKAALAEYQQSVGISPAVGYFGPITRAFINSSTTSLSTTSTTTTTTTTNLPAGCTSAVGYSSTTGQLCSAVVTYPAGCTSAVGYSPTTGQLCVSATSTTSNISIDLVPTVTTQIANYVLTNAVTLNGSIVNEGSSSSTISGFDYGLTTSYGSTITFYFSAGVGSFLSFVTGLSDNTTYHFRAKAQNSSGWGYGVDQTFTTASIPPYVYFGGGGGGIVVVIPTTTTEVATNISTSTVTLNGTLDDEGGASSTISGFDYGLTTSYTSEATSTYVAGVGNFSENIIGLTASTTYHFRSKLKNSAGWGYGNDQTFTTIDLPTVVTQTASNIATSTITLNGSITDEGNSSSTISGFDYGLTTNYTDQATSTYGNGVGNFSNNITSLTPNTAYHFRAKTYNSAGWGYGSDQLFATISTSTVTTQAATNISTSTVTLNGTLDDEGGASSTISGFDYGETIAYGSEATSTYGNGVGNFLENIIGLTPGTAYHFRAKTYNSAGWGYGSDVTLTTSAPSYSSVYPPAQNDTYVKAVNLGAGWEQYNATDPTKSLTAGNSGNSWGGSSSDRSQRFHIDLGTAMEIKRIMYVNASGGGSTDSNSTGIGVKNFTLWGSNTASAFNDGVFSHDTFWVQLTTSQATFDRHPVVNYFPAYNNTPTISYILVTGAASYRYYAFKFSDNWYSANYQSVRRIELQVAQ